MDWFWDHYLATPTDIENPIASPLNTKNLTGLAPGLILTAEYDPLDVRCHPACERDIGGDRGISRGEVASGGTGFQALIPINTVEGVQQCPMKRSGGNARHRRAIHFLASELVPTSSVSNLSWAETPRAASSRPRA